MSGIITVSRMVQNWIWVDIDCETPWRIKWSVVTGHGFEWNATYTGDQKTQHAILSALLAELQASQRLREKRAIN